MISLREKGTDTWIPAADFVPYVDTTNVIVEVKAEKSGFTPVTAEATVDIWPRPVTLVAASDLKVYDGLHLTNWTFMVKEDTTTPGYGFVKEEGVDRVTMTDDSTITLPGSVPNVIASETAKPNTKLERNYIVNTVDGTLTVTAATMGIEAFDAEKFYDAEPTNITYVVTNAVGGVISDAAISLREKGAAGWIPVADFTLYVDTTNVTVEVKAEKSGFDPVTAEATVLIKPRPVTLIAASDSKVYDGLPLTNWTFTVKEDTTTPGYGFVKDEGVSKVTMTDDSTITDPGSHPNVIATEVAKPGTKLDRNYIVDTVDGELKVTESTELTADATPYDGFYDGREHTIGVAVHKPEDAGEATVTYSYEEDGTYLPIADFEQLKDVTQDGPVTVYAKVEVEGYETVVVNSTVTIRPRIVVEQADSASKIFDGAPLMQPNHHEEPDVEAEKSKETWGTEEVPANSTGFVAGEGFAEVPMTASSTITEPGSEDNVIDVAKVTLLEGTKAGNYVFCYLPGILDVIQRQEEVRRDPKIAVPEESKKAVEESDRKIDEILDELVKNDAKADSEPYIKYQLTVMPTNGLSEATQTSPETAAEDAKRQIELFEEMVPDAKVDKVEFVDIVLERTYDKEEVEETAKGNYNKDNWELLDRAEDHANKLFEVTIPIEVPEGMELVGVTRSCVNKGDEVLWPKDPNDPDAEGFVYHPETKTVVLYARDFCVFGFIMQGVEDYPVLRPDGDEDLCSCDSHARAYEGTIISAGAGVVGKVSVTVSRPNKNGIASVKAKVTGRFQTGALSFSAKANFGGCPCSETEVEVPAVVECCCCCCYTPVRHELWLRFDGDTLTGWFDGDSRIDGGINVFKMKDDSRRAAIEDRVGNWSGVFDVVEVDGVSGFGTCSMTVKKSGSVSVRGKMPDGTVYRSSSTYQVGEDGIGVVPVVFAKKFSASRRVRGLGFRLVFRPDEVAPRAYDISPEQEFDADGEKVADLGKVGNIEVGRTVKTLFAVSQVKVLGETGLSDEPDEVKIKVNRLTNALTGKVFWLSVNAKDKPVKIVGTVKSGSVVNGVGYGMLSIKGVGLRPFSCECRSVGQ